MAKDIPDITIILPFFNAVKTLKRAIESIGSQTFECYECILVNNNSTDGSVQMAQEIVASDRRFKLIHEARQGVVYASNAASKIAKGKYIARMDADDVSFPQRLQWQYDFLEKHPKIDVVSGQVAYVSQIQKNTDGFKRYVDWVNSVMTYEDILKSQFIESPIVNPTAMWRQNVAKELGMYRHGDFPEDYELWLRWLHHGVKIEKLPRKLIEWHDSLNRLTRTNEMYSDEAFYRVKTKYLNLWLKKNHPHYPHIAVWGASRISRKYIDFLKEEHIEIDFYIDIKETRQLDKDIVFYKDLPSAGEIFVLVYVKHLKIKEEIQDFLHSRGFVQGVNYLLLS